MAVASPSFPCPTRATQDSHRLLSSRCLSSFSSSPSSSSPKSVTAISSSSRTFCLSRRRAELDSAISAFNGAAPNPPPSLYNSLIRALGRAGLHHRALSVFVLMLDSTALPDGFTFVLALKSCGQLAALDVGEQIHGILLKSTVLSAEDDASQGNALIHMYAQCGRIDRASDVFDRLHARNVVSWNCMIGGYARCEDVVSARQLFDEMPQRNIVSWNSMIGGYSQNGQPDEALALFLQLQVHALLPDEGTMAAVAAAISDLGQLALGESLHADAIRRGFSTSGALGVSMISMYSKCGSIEAARRLFAEIPNKNVAHWTAMIAGLAAHGFAESALQMFEKMLQEGVKPNRVTFVAVLNACSHGGLVEEGTRVLQLMGTLGVGPRREHLVCMVDLLARAGLLEEALSLAGGQPGDAEPAAWTALLSACRRRGAAAVAEIAASKLMEMEPGDGASYVLLSSVYAGQGRWEEFGRTRRTMARRGVGKVPGFSWIEVDGARHEFASGDLRHRRGREIYAALSSMARHLSGDGAGVDPETPT